MSLADGIAWEKEVGTFSLKALPRHFKHFDLRQADHYPHLPIKHVEEIMGLGQLQTQLAKNSSICVPWPLEMHYKTTCEQDDFYKWVHGIHLKNKLYVNVIDIGNVFTIQVKEIVNQLGWSAEAVREITVAWALYYGRYLYEQRHGHMPIYGDKFVQAALDCSSLEEVLDNKEL